MKIVLISPSCTKCKELLERNSVFRQFVSEVNSGKGMVAVGEEAYLYGFDYTFYNIFFGRVSYEAPSVMDLNTFDVVAVPEFSAREFVALLKKMPRVRTSKKSGAEGEEEARSSRRRRSSFVEKKQLKKDLKKALEGCLGDVCVEQ
jgi:hypothetical protein